MIKEFIKRVLSIEIEYNISFLGLGGLYNYNDIYDIIIESCSYFNVDIECLINSKNETFIHDVIGILCNYKKEDYDFFVPRLENTSIRRAKA